MIRRSFAVVLVLSGGGLMGCSKPGSAPPDPAAVAAGETVFQQRCSKCHSKEGLYVLQHTLTNDLGPLNTQMKGMTLTDQEIAQLKAFLAPR